MAVLPKKIDRRFVEAMQASLAGFTGLAAFGFAWWLRFDQPLWEALPTLLIP